MKARAWNLTVAGYSAVLVGLLAELPTIGASGTPAIATIGTAVLIAVGVLLAAVGVLQVRRSIDRNRVRERSGLALQTAGLLTLLITAITLQVSSTIPSLILAASFALGAGGLAITGAVRIRGDVPFLLLATLLIFGGLGLIVASQIGYYFVLSDVATTVVTDLGVAVSACGCVVGAYATGLAAAIESASSSSDTAAAKTSRSG